MKPGMITLRVGVSGFLPAAAVHSAATLFFRHGHGRRKLTARLVQRFHTGLAGLILHEGRMPC